MILYTVFGGVITVESVLRETKCGWRQHNNGFINRNELKDGSGMGYSIETHFHTTDMQQALEWQRRIVSYMHDLIQVCDASKSDVESWSDFGSDELNLPDSRFK